MKKIIALIAMLSGMMGWAGDSVPFLLDTTDPLITVPITYNSSWVGGDSSAEIVISADGTEIKRTTGEGEFVWSPTNIGKHTLTYTTYVNGVALDEVYTTIVYADWKYTVEDGKATIVETTQKSGNVTIPPEIDGFPVVGIERDVFAGCHGLFITVPPSFMNGMSAVKSFEQNEWVRVDSESGVVYKSNDIDHNGSTFMIATVKGPCEFSFDWKVSSESGYDLLRWYLDGSQKAEISGETSWQTVTYSLPEGEHTIKWEYSKDGSVDNGSDCGWVRMNENMTVIYNDYPFATGGDASWRNDEGLLLRSGSITNNLSSWIEMTVPGPGKLTYKWKSSSEYYEDESEGIYEIFDYGYLSVDNEAMGGLSDDDYALEGVAIGGHSDWQDEEFDVTGEGEHTLRWTYVKDGYDDEQMIGEDCIWVDQIKFRPYVTLSFDLGGGVGETPNAIYELHETLITLPSDAGFSRDNHVFDGWCDGNQKYTAGETYEMLRTNATLRAQWIEKRALSFNLGGGEGVTPDVIKNIPGTVITLPDTAGFDRAKYTFAGWNDGERTHAAGVSYTIAGKDVVFMAQWRANTISTPVISSRDIANGGVLNTASATISIGADSGASVYYTLDGSTPNAASVKYTAPFVADGLGSVTIKAIALRDNYFDSEVATFSFIRRPYSAAECLGVNGFAVVTEGDNAWFRVQGDSAHDGDSALQSGAIGEGGSSVVLMTVYGKGTISFWWKSSSHDGNRNRKYDYVSFEVDEDGEQAWLGGEKDWVNVTYDVPDEGEHTLKWIYKKNSDGTTAGEDCAWLDEVVWMGGARFDIAYENLKGATHQNPSSYYEGINIKFLAPSTVDGYAFAGWTPSEIVASDTGDKVVAANWEWAPQDAVVDASVTGWKPVTVKADWVKTELEQKFGAGKKESFIAKFGDDLASAMTKKTGKRDGAGNELLVWHDYVAGTDPMDINSTFMAKIDIQDGKPVISWEPNLNSAGEERVYTVHGKESLSDVWHAPVTELDHFFKVDVLMPYDVTVILNMEEGSSVGPLTVRVGQPLGELPTPTRDGYKFLGWYTAAEGGAAITPETVVTADMTIYARWEIDAGTPDHLEGLYAAYLFDGNLRDTSGHGYDLSGQSGSFVADRNGDADSAQYFDGNGKTVTTADCRVEAEFTFAFWCKTSVTMSESGSGDNSWSWSGNYILFPKNSQSDAGFGVKVGMDGISVMGHGNYYLKEQLGYSANIGTGWNHIAVSVSSDGAIGIYLNGVCVKTGTKPSSRKSVFVPEVGGGPYGYYTGCIDELLVFDKALDEDTIASIYSENIVFSDNPLYCVIDLSAGENAASYPVTYLSDVPAGGWTDEYKTTKLVLRRIEPGSFKMNGSYDVTITKAFYCGVFEVTQKQYELVTGSKPSNFSGDKLPVEQVSWNMVRGNSDTYNWPTIKTVDPNSFIGRIQARTGLNFDLPTEAQWEYACRAGTTTTYSYGDNANGEYMWNSNGSASESHDVGTKLSNPWGLYDMHGNVWEWCLDWRGTLSGGLDPEGASSGWERINRGGGSSGGASYCTSTFRNYAGPEEGWLNVGFRLVGNLSE